MLFWSCKSVVIVNKIDDAGDGFLAELDHESFYFFIEVDGLSG